MVAIAIIGVFESNHITLQGSPRGSGKSTTAAYYLLQDKYVLHHRVIANIHIDGAEYMTADEIATLLNNDELENVTILIDEFHLFVNSLAEKISRIKFYTRMFYQSRKKSINIICAWIRWLDVQIRIRTQFDFVLLPRKRHYGVASGNILDNCLIDNCKRAHMILVYCIKPAGNIRTPIKVLNPKIIGKYFNTHEIVRENAVMEFDDNVTIPE